MMEERFEIFAKRVAGLSIHDKKPRLLEVVSDMEGAKDRHDKYFSAIAKTSGVKVQNIQFNQECRETDGRTN